MQKGPGFKNASKDIRDTLKVRDIHDEEITSSAHVCQSILESIENVVLGKPLQVKQALACVLAKGHLLIEDVPGVGKTTLANALATALGMRFNRIQFTSDLMPSDIIGGSVYDRERQTFVFHPGPIFTDVLLADEINRSSPKTQSALLEAMAEGQVSVEGQTHKLTSIFFVLATQNPKHQAGTFQLPESQMDRFLMSISMGYPEQASEKMLLMSGRHRTENKAIAAVQPQQVLALQKVVEGVTVSHAVADYAWRVIDKSRTDNHFVDGLSPRAGMAWIRAAQAWALIEARSWITPDDLRAVFVQCAAHRLQPKASGQSNRAWVSADLLNWLNDITIE